MTETNVEQAFWALRSWIVNPYPDDYGLLMERINELISAKADRAELGRMREKHDWAAETALTDVAYYSSARTLAVFRRPTSFPTAVYQLLLRQMFEAEDHGVPTLTSTAPEKVTRLFEKNSSNGRLRLAHGEYVARNPKLHRELRQDAERVARLGHFMNGGYASMYERRLVAADAAREEVFQRHLAALLSTDEYAEASELTAELQRALYTHIWENGKALYADHLCATSGVVFRYMEQPPRGKK